jgi:multiple sugar transport system permease protein
VKPAFSLGLHSARITHQILVVGATCLSALIILLPVVWMINAAIRPIKEILTYPPSFIPTQFTFKYFEKIIFAEKYQAYFFNSTILALSTLVITIGLGLLAAYGFSRFKMPGGRTMLLGIVALLMLPPVVIIIPYFRLAHLIGLYDTLGGLILVNTAFILPIVIWLLKGYLDSIPIDLEEAAMIDGCTRLQALWHVLVPLTVPGIVGVGTYVFISAWNEYLLAITMTDTPASQPLTVGLAAFFGQYVRDWNSIMALSTLASLPLMLIFVFFQRWVVQGMTSGAVK